MKIGGFHPLSLSDYPGHVAAVVFAQGCNFRCPFCHNGGLLTMDIPYDKLISEGELFAHLQQRRDHLDGVVVTGGEPTLQAALLDFLWRIKNMGFAVKLDTNGSRPSIIRKLLTDGVVDYIAMDVKAPLHLYNKLCGVNVMIQRIEESIALISNSGVDHEFRTTFVESLLTEKDIDIIKSIIPSGSKYRLQEFRPEYALEPSL